MKTIYLLIRMEMSEEGERKVLKPVNRDVVTSYEKKKDAELHLSYIEGRPPIKDTNSPNRVDYFVQPLVLNERYEGTIDGRPHRAHT